MKTTKTALTSSIVKKHKKSVLSDRSSHVESMASYKVSHLIQHYLDEHIASCTDYLFSSPLPEKAHKTAHHRLAAFEPP